MDAARHLVGLLVILYHQNLDGMEVLPAVEVLVDLRGATALRLKEEQKWQDLVATQELVVLRVVVRGGDVALELA